MARKANLPKTKILLEITNCGDCPKCDVTRTPGWDYALSYFCKLEEKMVCSGIEWPSEMKPVPDWCPLRLKNETNSK